MVNLIKKLHNCLKKVENLQMLTVCYYNSKRSCTLVGWYLKNNLSKKFVILLCF